MTRRRLRWTLACLLVALCAASGGVPSLHLERVAHAQASVRVVTHEDITVTSATAVGLSSTTYQPTVNGRTRGIAACHGRVETTKTRYRFDGTAPTGTVGSYFNADDAFDITRFEDAVAILFISTGANSTVHVDCWTQ